MPGIPCSKPRRCRPTTAAAQWSITFAGLMAAVVALLAVLLSTHQNGQGGYSSPVNDALEVFEFRRAVGLVQTKERLRRVLAPMVAAGTASVAETERGFLVRLSSDALFTPDTLSLRPDNLKTLQKLAWLLARIPNMIHVYGHTEGPAPAADAPLLDNWSLAAAHAAAVANFFATIGEVDTNRLQAVGRGRRALWDSGAYGEGGGEGALNARRVEILVSNKLWLMRQDAVSTQAMILLSDEDYGLEAQKPKSLRLSPRLWDR